MLKVCGHNMQVAKGVVISYCGGGGGGGRGEGWDFLGARLGRAKIFSARI